MRSDMRRWTDKRLRESFRTLERLADAALRERGAEVGDHPAYVETDDDVWALCSPHEYVIETRYGRLRIWPCANTIEGPGWFACRFLDGEPMDLDSSPSGKWNHHYHDGEAESALADFLGRIDAIRKGK